MMPITPGSQQVLFGETEADQPLVSIITVVFNGARHLEEAMRSVFSQTYPTIEYIVIDGGSTDGSLEIINKYRNRINKLIVEPDRGIYDAMNKGIGLAQGEIIGLLNSDDLLFPESIQKVAEAFSKDKAAGFAYGPVHVISATGEVEGSNNPVPPGEILNRMVSEMPFPHTGCFVSRHIYEEIGLFDTSLKLTADYDFILRFLKHGYKGIQLDQPIACFRRGGQSDGIRVFAETRKVHQKHGVGLVKRNLLFFLSSTKVILSNLIPKKILVQLKKIRKKSRHVVYDGKTLK